MALQDAANARRRLDARLDPIRPALASLVRPHRGWIRAVRDALGMSTSELAARMGIAQQTAFDLERSELQENIHLGTLRRTADALDCDLVYCLVPRTSLDEAVHAQARRKAARHLATVAHQSRLEDQSVDAADTAAQLDELSNQFIDRRGLWKVEPNA